MVAFPTLHQPIPPGVSAFHPPFSLKVPRTETADVAHAWRDVRLRWEASSNGSMVDLKAPVDDTKASKTLVEHLRVDSLEHIDDAGPW